MRYALMLAALAAILAPGCQKKPKGPQTTAIDSEPRPLEELKPAAAPPAQTLITFIEQQQQPTESPPQNE